MLDPRPGTFFIDGTLGAGGHAMAILEREGNEGIFLGVDRDKRAVTAFKEATQKNTSIVFPQSSLFIYEASYADIPGIIQKNSMPKADGLLLDLGFSSDQIEDAARGMSFMKNGPLDMRYADDGETLTARDIVNTFPETEIADIVWKYGEERFSRRIAGAIVRFRNTEKIETTDTLRDIVLKAVPMRFRHGRIHPATKTFQALRIFVNKELEHLTTLLDTLPTIMASGSRVAIISFHSLEDRIVKERFRELARQGVAHILTKKPVCASEEEAAENPRSRSAKLRVLHIL